MKRDLLIVYEKGCKRAAEYLKDEIYYNYELEVSKMKSEKYFHNKEYVSARKKVRNIKDNDNKLKYSESNPVIFITHDYKNDNKFKFVKDKLRKNFHDIDYSYKDFIGIKHKDFGIEIGKKHNKIIVSVQKYPEDIKNFEKEIESMKEYIRVNSKSSNKILVAIKKLGIAIGFGVIGLSIDQILSSRKKRKKLLELQTLLGVFNLNAKYNELLDDFIKMNCLERKEMKKAHQDGYIIFKGNKFIHEARKVSSNLYHLKKSNYIVMDYETYSVNESELPNKTKIFIGSHNNKDFEKDLMVNKNNQEIIHFDDIKGNKIISLNEKIICFVKDKIDSNITELIIEKI